MTYSGGRPSNRRTSNTTRSLKSQRWYLAENDRKPCEDETVEGSRKAQGGRSRVKRPSTRGTVLVVCIAPKDARECPRNPASSATELTR